MGRPGVTARMEEILRSGEEETPFLLVDLDIVRDRFERLTRALPDVAIHYAVKANPAPEVLTLLNDLGSSFDVASPGEIVRCLGVGVDPSRLSYGSTIKKQRDIAWAYERGVRLFAIDSEAELRKVGEAAPGSTVFCRIACDGSGADWPLSRKFGCDPELALELLLAAHRMGLQVGLSFHVGSQQRDPDAWDRALATVADIHAVLRAHEIEPAVVNLGGGFPANYIEQVPDIATYGAAINGSLQRRLGDRRPGRVMIEPGRYLVADAGVVQAEVVLVARKAHDDTNRGSTSTSDCSVAWPRCSTRRSATASAPPMTGAWSGRWCSPGRAATAPTCSTSGPVTGCRWPCRRRPGRAPVDRRLHLDLLVGLVQRVPTAADPIPARPMSVSGRARSW